MSMQFSVVALKNFVEELHRAGGGSDELDERVHELFEPCLSGVSRSSLRFTQSVDDAVTLLQAVDPRHEAFWQLRGASQVSHAVVECEDFTGVGIREPDFAALALVEAITRWLLSRAKQSQPPASDGDE